MYKRQEKTTFDPNQSGNTFMAANFTVTDAADDLTRVDLGGRRIIKKKSI
ncbi:hypothetical protein JMUB7523_26620 [Staphylococcus aureus]